MSVGLYPVGTVAVAATKVAAGSPDVTVAITGVSATSAVGSLVAAIAVAVTGVSGTGDVGDVTASVSGDVTVAITGVLATGSVGSVVGGVAYPATGVAGSAAVGAVSADISVPLSGASGTGAVGSVGTTGGTPSVRTKGLRKTRYVPSDPPGSPNELPRYLKLEHERLNDALESPFTHISLETLYVEPSRKKDGMIVLADGTQWNPGSGAGVYAYYGGSWKKLG